MSKPKLMWQCSECDELHDWEDDAMECCAPSVYQRWVCAGCEDAHCSEAEAEDCCADSPDSPECSGPTAAELEAAGQQKLAL